jgi:ABC-type uncharacterized transport system permease subunit
MHGILLHGLCAAAYAVLAFCFLPRAGALSRLPPARVARLLVLAAAVLHARLLFDQMFGGGQLRFGFSYALSATALLGVLLYWVESFFFDLDAIYRLLLPIAAVCVLISAFVGPGVAVANAASNAFRAHFVVALLAYATGMVAALHALLTAVAERRLHHAGDIRRAFELPPLLVMERVLFRSIGLAFVLLSVTLISGAFYSERVAQRPLPFSHKTVFALASWLIFGGLLIGRYSRGWRGRTAVRWTLAGFVTLLLAYVGSRFVSQVILHR